MHSIHSAPGPSCCPPVARQSAPVRHAHAQHHIRRQQHGSFERRRDASCCSMAESRVEVSTYVDSDCASEVSASRTLWSQHVTAISMQAPSVPAEEPLKEPINEDLDVSRTVVNASYRSVVLWTHASTSGLWNDGSHIWQCYWHLHGVCMHSSISGMQDMFGLHALHCVCHCNVCEHRLCAYMGS